MKNIQLNEENVELVQFRKEGKLKEPHILPKGGLFAPLDNIRELSVIVDNNHRWSMHFRIKVKLSRECARGSSGHFN